MPTVVPRKRISIARVAMKALRRNFTTRKPFTSPTARPTRKTTAMPAVPPMPMPDPPWVVSVTISQAATMGANPTTDSSDRSNLPPIRISDCAMTRIDSSEDCCRMLSRLSLVRNAGLTKVPTIMTSTITGSSTSSRSCSREAHRREAMVAAGCGRIVSLMAQGPRRDPRWRRRDDGRPGRDRTPW